MCLSGIQHESTVELATLFSLSVKPYMKGQIGNGILDSLGSFFRLIPTKVSNAYNNTFKILQNNQNHP